MTVVVTVANAALVYMTGSATYTINFSAPAMGEVYEVTAPTGDGFTFTGKETAYQDSAYSFQIAVDEGYDGTKMVVKVNDVTVNGTDGRYTVESVSDDLVITVEGVEKKQTHTVTLTEGTSYTISSNDTPYAGEDYTFTVTVDDAIYKAGEIVVKADEDVLTGTDGTYTIPALDGDKTVTVTNVVERQLFNVTGPETAGVTFTGDASVREGKDYAFIVAINDGYKAGENFAVAVNGETVTGMNGSYTVENVSGDLTITVAGVESKTVYNVTLPTDATGYTVTGAPTVYEGESYSFTVTIDKSYKAGENFAVNVTGGEATGTNGTYTVANVASDLTITVTGVIEKSPEEMVEPTVVYRNGVDGSNWPYKSGYLNTVTIDGANVKKYSWNGNTCEVQLVSSTPKDAMITFTIAGSGMFFGTSGIKLNGTSISSSGTVTLSEGAATAALYIDSAFAQGTKTFNLSIAESNELPRLADPNNTGETKELPAGEGYTLNLAELFTDPDGEALTYNLSVNGADAEAVAVEENGEYTYQNNIAGEYTLVFTATDSKGDTSEDAYTVTLTVTNSTTTYAAQVVVPDGIEASFYAFGGYDANGTDICGDALTAKKSGNTYTVQVPANLDIICFRTAGGSGQAIAVSEDAPASLRKVMVSGADKFDNAVNAAVTVKDADGHAVTAGTDGFILSVGETYALTTTPSNTTTYKTASSEQTIAADTDAIEALVEFNNLKTVKTPTGAAAQIFMLINNYYSYKEIVCAGTEDNGDGTSTHYFPGALGVQPTASTAIYRVTYGDNIVKAGWMSAGSVTVTFSESDLKNDARVDYSTSSDSNKGVADDGVLLNVNGQNHLAMSVNDTKTLKAYRVWEIIPVSYNNWIIEPDFHFDVVWESETGIVSLEDKANPMTGGESWQTLTANKAGTAIIEVTYDAIQVSGGSSWSGTYGASDPARTGLMVVTVGGADTSVDFGIQSFASQGSMLYNSANAKKWDAEFDTLYFTGGSGELKFVPTAGGDITNVAVSHDKGANWQTLTASDGVYTAPIVSGNNLLRVTTANGVAYQVVRGDKVTVTVQEQNDADDNETIEAGETVRITLDGLHTPIPKMAGNYNPGYRGNTDGDGGVHIKYTYNGETVSGPKTQYDFHTAAKYIDVTIPDDASGSVSLTDGYIGVGVIGLTQFADGGDSHRNIPDSGCGTRGSTSTFHTRSILPEITIALGAAGAANQPPAPKSDAPTAATREVGQNYTINPAALFTDPDGDNLTITVAVDNGTPEMVAGNFTYTPTAAGTYALKFTATDPDGKTAEHTIILTATAPTGSEDELTFDISGDQIAGYVTISFEDYGVRPDGVVSTYFQEPLGIIIEQTQVPYAVGDNVAAVTVRLLKALGIGYDNSGSVESGFYLSAIKNFEVDNTPYDKMGEYDAGSGSGWMITLNDVFINRGTSDFTVKSDDVIRWQYTCQLGADIGDTATMVNVTLVDKGEIVLAQERIPVYNHNDNNVIDVDDVLYAAHNAHYTGGADAGYAVSNGFATKLWGDTSKNFYFWLNNVSCNGLADEVKTGDHLVAYVMTESSDAYAHFDSFTYTATAGTALPVTLKYAGSWNEENTPVFSNFAKAEISAYDSEMTALAADAYTVTNNNDGTYTVTFDAAGSYYLVAKNADNSTVLVPAVAKVTCAPDTSGLAINAIYEATAETLLETKVGTGSTNGEWLMFGLARALDKNPTAEQKSDHLAAVKNYIAANIKADGKLHENKATENQRIALALTALGYDAAAFEGKDLLKALTDTAWVTGQGNNSTAFALLTINAAGYAASNEQALLNSLLNKKMTSGAWSISGDEADSDTTAMAVQALAPYYNTNEAVKTAVDKALTYLAAHMNANGQIKPDGYNATAENTAQVIVALCELGRDPANNAQFTKNGKTLLDGLKSFYLEEEKGFAHEYGETDSDPMATEQSFYAMVAYKRLLAKTASLYDMSDYNITVVPAVNGTVDVAASATADSVVTITLNPAVGYTVDKVYVGSTAVDVTYSNDTYTATFTMPASDVVISATFKLSENASAELQAAMAALTNADVNNADKDAYELLGEIEAAITALNLSEAELTALKETTEYQNYAAKLAKFEEELDELIDDAEYDLEELFEEYDEKNYTEKNWKKIEDLYEDALDAVKLALYAEEIEDIVETAEDDMEDVPVGGALEVTFRLIGDFKHDNGVTDHSEYVTWIETTDYTLEAGATMYDLFMMAIDDAGLSQKGAKNNYVESIQAPDVLGGYWIGEFDNGRNSGWMYTIDGDHPGTGLVYQELEDGDEVIWHYVDDYTKEERNSSSPYYYRWLEAKDISPEKYVERTIGEIVTVGKNGEVKPELDINDIGKDITFKFQPDNGYVVKDVIIDGESMGAIESYTYKDLSVDSCIEVTFVPTGMEEILTVGKNGSVYPELEPDDLGRDVTFTFAPNAGCVVGKVIVDGKNIGTVTSYTYKNLSLESRIEVTFVPAAEITFSDVADGLWYTEAVQYVAANGFFSGTGNGKFSPNTTMSRAMMVTVLHNMAQNPPSYNSNVFSDVASGAWYDTAVRWAVANGITSGYPSGTFGTNDDVTREQIAVFLYNYAKHMGYDVSSYVSLTSYADDQNVSTYAQTAMEWAVAEGIISGRAGNLLAAKSNASRAEVAAMVYNFMENVAQ